MMPYMDPSRIVTAGSDIDPQLGLASAPFATWIGVIEVDPGGEARLLRSGGDEDTLPGSPATAALVEAWLARDDSPVDPGTAVWLPLAMLYPVLEHLSPKDAFDVATRMPAPRAEFVARRGDRRALALRAALVDGRAGWIGGCPTSA